MALGSLLSIAQTALQAHQQATEVTGHNIANSETVGYTRQIIRLKALTPQSLSFGSVGRGVGIDGIVRQRSLFLDVGFRQESATLGHHSTLGNKLGQLEAILGEPAETGLAGALDRMFAAFNDLANAPSDGASRALVVAGASEVVRTFRSYDERLLQVASNIREEVVDSVKSINSLARQIADLNPRITQAEGNGRPANDLRDRRDLLIDQLAELVPVRTIEQENGSVSVMAGDTLLVDRATAQAFEVSSDSRGQSALRLVGSDRVMVPTGGSLAGLLEVVNIHVPKARASLDGIARAVAAEVNIVHRTGVTATGATNVDFFDPDGLTAETIGLSLMVAHSPNEIAAGTTGAPGDGTLALQIAQLRTVGVASLDGVSIHEGYNQMVTSIGVQVQDAGRIAEAQDVLVLSIDQQRSGVHGVSIDEEMVGLITHQQAYAAAARLVTTADEMLQELLNMV